MHLINSTSSRLVAGLD